MKMHAPCQNLASNVTIRPSTMLYVCGMVGPSVTSHLTVLAVHPSALVMHSAAQRVLFSSSGTLRSGICLMNFSQKFALVSLRSPHSSHSVERASPIDLPTQKIMQDLTSVQRTVGTKTKQRYSLMLKCSMLMHPQKALHQFPHACRSTS